MMTSTALMYYLGLSLITNVALFLSYRRERDRRALIAVCLDLPHTSDWWPVYSAMHRLTIKVEKILVEDN